MSVAAQAVPHRAPYTVDDLFDLPDDGNRYEVLGGSLVVSPAPSPGHRLAADELRHLIRGVLHPLGITVITATAVRMPGGDGPIPDVVVTDAEVLECPRALPHEQVHTVIEVVSPSNALVDRAYKRELYAEAGIPCYWRIELDPWHGHQGALPLVVARVLLAGGWHTVEAAAGAKAALPLAIGRAADGTARTVDVELDPGMIVEY